MLGYMTYTIGGLAVLKAVGSVLGLIVAIIIVLFLLVGIGEGTEHIKKKYCPYIYYIPKKKEE